MRRAVERKSRPPGGVAKRAFGLMGLGLGLGLGLALGALPGLAGPPSPAITIDGDLSDWQAVLLEPRLLARDADGSSFDCADSSDRDCPVTPDTDLLLLGWSAGPDDLHLLLERRAASPDWRRFYVYLDADRDGLMEDGELVVRLRAGDGGQTPDIAFLDYSPVAPGGDPMVSPAGLGDGWSLPGTAVGRGAGQVGAVAVNATARFLEAAMPWSQVGVPPGSAVDLHWSSADTTVPVSLRDNGGGSGGGPASTAWSELRVEPEELESGGSPGQVVRFVHRARNEGNVTERVLVELSTACGSRVELWRDEDLDGIDDVRLAVDADGDGRLDGPADELAPAGDPDGDGRLDLGLMAPGTEQALGLLVSAPGGGCDGELLAVVFRSADRAETFAAVADRLWIGEWTLTPREQTVPVAPGETTWLQHELRAGSVGGLACLDLVDGFGWGGRFESDPVGNGDPADFVPVPDANGNGLPELQVPAGESRSFFVRVEVPAGAAIGLENPLLVQVLQAGTVQVFARDLLRVRSPFELRPSHLRDLGLARRGPAGSAVFFPHRLQSARGLPDEVRFAASSDRGWPVTLLGDPNGDGLPGDGVPLGPGPVTVPGSGGTFDLIARVDVPAAATLAERTRLTVTAVSDTDPAATAEAFDDAEVSIASVHLDPARLVALVQPLPCWTVHGLGSGLAPDSAGHRFVWRDGAGAALRVAPFRTDSAGRGFDDLLLGPAALGSGFSFAVELGADPTWTEIDRTDFDVLDPLRLVGGAPSSAAASLHVTGSTLSASARLANVSELHDVEGVELLWRVLTPDRGRILDADTGAFLPFSGAELSAREPLSSIPRGSERELSLVARPAFEVEGLHLLAVAWRWPCGAESAWAESGFEVMDDEDGDGLSRAVETSAGTDPRDADSDDDGVPDGEDGLTDSDGDGLIDALDCDADDDGLPDGLETGVSVPGPDTDRGAGCFLADSDPTSTTDPRDPDTDDGGVPDGLEDRDRDGRVDAGELDPLLAADDPACAAEPPPEVLGLRVAVEAPGLRLSWTDGGLDPCASWTLLASAAPSGFAPVASDLLAPEQLLDAPVAPGGRLYFLVRADSSRSGEGPLGPGR